MKKKIKVNINYHYYKFEIHCQNLPRKKVLEMFPIFKEGISTQSPSLCSLSQIIKLEETVF